MTDGISKASGAAPLYMYRPVLNAEQLHEWATQQGFESALEPDDMHVTVVFSRAAFSHEYSQLAATGEVVHGNTVVIRGGKRTVAPLGDKGAVVLKVPCGELQMEHQYFREAGASWDYPEYQPHVTITYAGAGLDATSMQPFEGDIVLGPLRAKVLNANWDTQIVETPLQKSTEAASGLQKGTGSAIVQTIMDHEVTKSANVIKLDSERRIAWGWASVATMKGELVADLQGDTISPSEMEKMADRFMVSARTAKAMHDGDGIGEVLHSLPLTADLAKALGIAADREGWIIGMKIKDDAVWAGFKDGTYKAFSIGGKSRRRPK